MSTNQATRTLAKFFRSNALALLIAGGAGTALLFLWNDYNINALWPLAMLTVCPLMHVFGQGGHGSHTTHHEGGQGLHQGEDRADSKA